MLVMAIPSTIGAVIAILALKSKPPTPPSTSAAEKPDAFFVGLKKVSQSKPFLLLTLAFGCGVGIFTAMTTLMAQIVASQGYDDNDAGAFSGILVGVGLIGGGVTGIILDRTHAFLPIIRTAFFCATASFVMFNLCNKVFRLMMKTLHTLLTSNYATIVGDVHACVRVCGACG